MPAFHAIMVVRDEGDIIAQTLAHLMSWCDSLAVFDTGSADRTWEIVREAAAGDARITLIGSEPVLFHNGLRGWVFDRVRRGYRDGDWVARVDADEFYHVPPPEFVRERVRWPEGRVCARLHDFVLTRSELKDWQDGRESLADRSRPIEERRRVFRYDDYPELRLFRYRRSMRWPPTLHNPHNAGLLARERIPVRHYRARDPLQVQVRCAVREPVTDAVGWAGDHWRIPDWRSFVMRDDDPRLVRWGVGEPLPERRAPDLRGGWWSHLAQRALYGSGLVRVLDRTRPLFPRDFAPTPLPPDLRERTDRNLAGTTEKPYLREAPGQFLEWRERTGR